MANERILIADDEPQIVQLCVQLLSEQGYQVKGVTGGQEAIALLEAESFDLLVVDIRMPDVDGLMVLRWGVALDPNLTTVMITGYATMNRVIEALNSGARGILLKPFGIEEFYAAIESALAQRQKEQERLRLRAQLPIMVLGQTLMTEGDEAELSRRLLEVVARQMGATRAALMLIDERTDDLYVVATMGLLERSIGGMRVADDGGIPRQALEAQDVLVWDTGPLDELEMPLGALVSGSGGEALVAVPLCTGNQDVGILILVQPTSSARAAALTQSDLSLLSIMGRQIAVALENARMYSIGQQRTIELARALDQQRELDRLKNQFIQNVSHELRTPLSMILGYAELLAAGELGEVRPEQQGPLNIIVQRACVLRDLIGNITAILESEMREPVWEPVSLSELVGEAMTDFQVLADQAGLELHGDISAQVAIVLGDAEHLRRVVDNLIGNALKFTPRGGQVAVRLSEHDAKVTFQVVDTGIGIAPEDQEKIFERFYQVDGTTRRTHGGCGLGLALVKEIVERHGGGVSVESKSGQGSTFTVWLPAGAVTG
ncbi:MAG: ATP-binding protein [Anaerolineae bacterium]|jgi:signal transduction histidine kinase/CheY-like chemotaxis protein